MELHIFITGILGFLAFLSVIMIIAWAVIEYRLLKEKRETAYNVKYEKIKDMIITRSNTKESRLRIRLNIIELERLSHKNWEKTDVLCREYKDKFESNNAVMVGE
jgi:hypothetical protein